MQLLRISMTNMRQLRLFAQNHTILQTSAELAAISLSNPSSVTSSNNLLAYRPRFVDAHNSNLAGVFINMEGVFNAFNHSLITFQYVKSSLMRRMASEAAKLWLVLVMMVYNHFRVFSTTSDILTYGVAIQDCPEFNATCFPIRLSFNIACYLPRAVCSWHWTMYNDC